jgi:hypothetical protein
MRSIGQIEPIAVRAGKLRGVMTDKRKAFERIMTQLPQLQERHAARMIARNVLGGDTLDMVKSFFDDLNEVKWMLVDVESNSLPALNMFILYLDYFECTADAWKLRLLTKRKFPNATIKTEQPDMVTCPPWAAHRPTTTHFFHPPLTGSGFLFDDTRGSCSSQLSYHHDCDTLGITHYSI